MYSKLLISVIICTYNRADHLLKCLDSILIASDNENLELIVVDNNSTDNTKKVVKQFSKVKYVFESNQGLSHARNRGAKEASGDWLFYIDDDCKVKKDIFVKARKSIAERNYKLITGIYKAWYTSPPPRWLPYHIGNYSQVNFKELRPIENFYVSGGVFLLHKQTFIENTKFPIQLGMKGKEIGYGEETHVEYEYRKKGIPVGINPNLVIYHQVLPHKYKLRWILKSSYKKGIYSLGNNNFVRSVVAIPWHISKFFFWTLVKRKLHFKSVHSLEMIAYRTGVIKANIFSNQVSRSRSF